MAYEVVVRFSFRDSCVEVSASGSVDDDDCLCAVEGGVFVVERERGR